MIVKMDPTRKIVLRLQQNVKTMNFNVEIKVNAFLVVGNVMAKWIVRNKKTKKNAIIINVKTGNSHARMATAFLKLGGVMGIRTASMGLTSRWMLREIVVTRAI